jgi:decaprenylphosphoryl-5-phosphoribose phosphatase
MPASLSALDLAGVRLARRHGHAPAAERAVRAFSALGEHAGVWLALGAMQALREPRRRTPWLRAMGVVGTAYVANTAIKLAVRRPRPQLPDLPPLTGTPTQLSFPSAHASSSFAGALLFSRLGLPAAGLYGLAGGLALSRLYLGVHYPSDVLAGAVLGTAGAALSDGWVQRS